MNTLTQKIPGREGLFRLKSMQIPHLGAWKKIMVLVLLLSLCTTESYASHFRYGSISWTRTSTSTKEVKFKIS
jgi:hypothetical protein